MRVAATAIALLAFLAACSSEPPTFVPEGPYAAEIQFAQENASSDFERKALADGVISEEEYDEGHLLWLECMEDHYPPGSAHQVGIRKVEEGGWYEFILQGSPPEEMLDQYDRLSDACYVGTLEYIADLYYQTTFNPERLDRAILMFQCLERDNLIPAGYTQEDFEIDHEAYFSQSPMNPDSPMALLPENVDVHMCLGAPHHNK